MSPWVIVGILVFIICIMVCILVRGEHQIKYTKEQQKSAELDASNERNRATLAESKLATVMLQLSAEERALIEETFKKVRDLGDSLTRNALISEVEKAQLNMYKHINQEREFALETMKSGLLKAYPYLASVMADYLTYDIEILAKQLDWGDNQERKKKVTDIRIIRQNAKERIEEAKLATYQLNYLLSLYPALQDVLDTEYNDLDYKGGGIIPDYDPIRYYISDEEWHDLSESEKNQRALDNYIQSHEKTKWQIGRDYELYIGYEYEKKGYHVEYFGELNGVEDLGRDLICRKQETTLIIQCKYWSKESTIHEKHIFQLFATTVSYCLDHRINPDFVSPIFITKTKLSDKAKQIARQLKITVVENKEMGEYPRIKCNIGKDEYGHPVKIYHLPMDQQYDNVKIDSEGECMAFTVNEAESKGFRRAYKWHG